MDRLPVSPPREGHTQSKAPLALPLVRHARLRMASSPRRMEGGGSASGGRQLQASASIPSPAGPPLAPGPAEPEWISSLLQVLPPQDPPAGSWPSAACVRLTARSGGQEKRAAEGCSRAPQLSSLVVVWFLPGCPCKTFMKMLSYSHWRLQIAVKLAKSRVPQECGTLRKCLRALPSGRALLSGSCLLRKLNWMDGLRAIS